MFKSFNTRQIRHTTPRLRSLFAIGFVSALLAVPVATAAKTPAAPRVNLSGLAAYCPTAPDGLSAPTAPTTSVGSVAVTTPDATSPGFNPVNVDIRVRGGKLAPGTYQVWLVELFRDDTGAVMGCSASQFADSLVVRNGGPVDFQGSVTRYTGEHELQIYVGSILGSGYETAPAIVDVP